jgi:hypothetical protein
VPIPECRSSALENLIREFLVDNPRIVNKPFEENRPLGTFSSCIEMAYCLGLIGPDTHTNLNAFLRIRNVFAHSYKKTTFKHDNIASLCNNLRIETDDLRRFESPREKFVIAVATIGCRLVLKLLPLSHRQVATDCAAHEGQEFLKVVAAPLGIDRTE